MRRRRKRRHVESGPAEFATADFSQQTNGRFEWLACDESGGGKVTNLWRSASLREDDISPSTEQTLRLL
jgi:hypothetical protein